MDVQGNEFKDFASKDLFPQLTDDLLLLILSMLNCDLKFLCQCMLISKRFALLIPLISSGTLSIPGPQVRSFFLGQVTYAFRALKSFPRIRSLHLIFIEEEDQKFDLKWKAVFRSNTCSCACLVYNSIAKLSSVSGSVSATTTAADSDTITSTAFRYIVTPNLWRKLLEVRYPLVDSVVITDSKRQGKVCYRNLEPRDARTYSTVLDIWNNSFGEGQTSFKFIETPELRLPKSGFIMKGVYLAICKVGENSTEDDDILSCSFGEEEIVFGEALTLVLGTPKDKMRVSRRSNSFDHCFPKTDKIWWSNLYDEAEEVLKVNRPPDQRKALLRGLPSCYTRKHIEKQNHSQ
ncbi:hypothetical protein ACET3Z_019445 [Daucus carota]